VPTTLDVLSVGRAAGLDAVGVAPAEPFTSTLEDLRERKAQGLHGGMAFTYRNPERSTDPARTVEQARALVVGARSYGHAQPTAPAGGPAGRVARYVWHDHYQALRQSLGEVADALRGEGWRAVVVADDNALVDREAAYRAGLGWYGKNANLLLPGQGSWFVLGSVVTDAPLPPTGPPQPDGCGSCRRCVDGCPTGAIIAPGVVDARRCLAWLVQAEGTFPEAHREALGDRIYGCDDCQEVCPPNRRADRDLPAASARPDPTAAAWVPLLDLLAASDEALMAEHGRWYIPRRDPRYLRRNALVALGNVGDAADPRVLAALREARDSGDDLLAEHATWALARIAHRSGGSERSPAADPSARTGGGGVTG
jgi:epoxyqueuosine reductase